MTIKTKLTLNVAIVLVVIGAVAAASIIGMGFVRSKLTYLTERSTPFQMRTLEFQRATQGAASGLVKTNVSSSMDEYKTSRGEAEKSLAEVKNTQEALESLSGGERVETYGALSRIASELFETTEARLKAEEEAGAADKMISQRLKDTSGRLKDLNEKIKGLQLTRSASFMTSLEDTKSISSTLRSIEAMRGLLKDLNLVIFEVQKAQEKRDLIITRGKFNSVLSKLLQNEYLMGNKRSYTEVKQLGEKVEELIKLQMALLGQANEEMKNRYSAINSDVSERLSSILLMMEQEVASASDKYKAETAKQDSVFTQANISSNVLTSNSELVALGLSIEGLTTRLFTISSTKEADAVTSDLRKVFERVDQVEKSLDKSLAKLDAKQEMKILRNVEGSLGSIKTELFSGNGVIAKIRRQLEMREKAQQETGKLREIVLKQAEKGKETVTAARSEQEKAIGTVNRMVRMNIMLIGAISAGAVIFGIAFGTWVYRSISNPLNRLMKISDQVSGGDLRAELDARSGDEIGIVQASMAKMVTNLREIVGKISTATGSLASSSEELAATAATLEKGSRDQAMQTEQSATAMTQMSQTTLDVAKNASDTSGAAQKMKKTAVEGKDAMDITVKELMKFAETVKESALKVESLGGKSGEISNVITLIKEIADQTNLLALNAAIEAARAGEQGRGFAVVADSVRQLAERTTHATDDIAHTVKSMQTEVEATVGFMREERESIGKLIGNVQGTLKAIDEIASYVEQVTDMIQRIAAATEEQSAAADEVSQSMTSIDAITKHLGSSVTELKRTSEDLSKFASELNTMAGWFKV